ncbi:hypothetical protein ACO0K3_17820, partial [Undibacterium sp. Rencai35W]|uniref:hypothetical protein n=1 Tax=Undibacterium sp. Rencai35W TaxID=3413046 RepID=UPI003BEFD2E7
STQKKATAQSLPFGFPFEQVKKWEVSETRLRLRQRTLLFPFSNLLKRQRHSGLQINCNCNFNFKSKSTAIALRAVCVHRRVRRAHHFR